MIFIMDLIRNHPEVSCAIFFGVGFATGLVFRSKRLFPFSAPSTASPVTQGDAPKKFSGEYKLILVVRNDLKMGKGKIAAQCAHAAVGAVEKMAYANLAELRHWQNQGQTKVAVKVEDEQSLMDVKKAAEAQGLNTCVIRDAGRTQIAPGSKTVLAVGPGPATILQDVTGHLKLL